MSKSKRREIPRFQTPIVETHCHLDYLEGEELTSVLERSREVGVERIITIAVSPDNLETVRNIAHNNDDVWCTQGIHPHEAASFTDTVATSIRQGAADDNTVAIGEIGLDYYLSLIHI